MPGSRKKKIERKRSSSSKANARSSQKSQKKGKSGSPPAENQSQSGSQSKPESAEVVEYKTILDDLYAQVNQEGEISLAVLSKRTNIAEATLEEWGRVFDKQGMLELAYPFVGGALLRKKGYVSKVAKEKSPAAGQAQTPKPAAEALKIAAGVSAKPTKEEEAKQKPHSKKSSGLILIVLVIVLLALIGVAVYLLINGGYLHLG